MSQNILGIISLFLAIAGITEAVPSVYLGRINKNAHDDYWYPDVHYNYPKEKYYDDPFTIFAEPSLSKPSGYKRFSKYQIDNYFRNVFSRPKKADKINLLKILGALSTGYPVSNKESNSLITTKVYEINTSTLESTTGNTDINHSVSHDSHGQNLLLSKSNTEFPNLGVRSDVQETNDSTSLPEEIPANSNKIQIAQDVFDTNTTSVFSNNSSKSDLDFSVVNVTSIFNITDVTNNSTTDFESASTSQSEIADQTTRSGTLSPSTEDATSTVFDFTAERARKTFSSFEVKSTRLESKASETIDGQNFVSKLPVRSTEDSDSSRSETPPKPIVSYQVTDKTTNSRYLISDPQTGIPGSTKLPENSMLTQSEQVIELQGIRTLKIVVSVVFMAIAFVAGTVLIVFVFKVKRQEVQYDQLTLIP